MEVVTLALGWWHQGLRTHGGGDPVPKMWHWGLRTHGGGDLGPGMVALWFKDPWRW